VDVDELDLLGQYLRYDGQYNLAICVECKYGLPLEWIHNHFKKVHKVKVYAMDSWKSNMYSTRRMNLHGWKSG